MRKRGYEPLATDSFGGIGFKKSIKGDDDEESFEQEPWQGDVWFDTGKKMQDGITPRTVLASTVEKYSEYLKKGYSPVKDTSDE
jgi:hypothetical protein